MSGDFLQIPKEKNKPSKLEVAAKYLLYDPMANNPYMFLGNEKNIQEVRNSFKPHSVFDTYFKGQQRN